MLSEAQPSQAMACSSGVTSLEQLASALLLDFGGVLFLVKDPKSKEFQIVFRRETEVFWLILLDLFGAKDCLWMLFNGFFNR